MTIMQPILQTEIEKKRAAWWSEHYKAGMSTVEVFELVAECVSLFPATLEERRQKTESLMAMPEFVL